MAQAACLGELGFTLRIHTVEVAVFLLFAHSKGGAMSFSWNISLECRYDQSYNYDHW